MSRIIEILNFEEGYRETPYWDTRNFPTVAGGIRIALRTHRSINISLLSRAVLVRSGNNAW